MIKFTIKGPRTIEGEPTTDVQAPILPRVGEYVSHDPSGISGSVKSVGFWWPEDGSPVEIEVSVR